MMEIALVAIRVAVLALAVYVAARSARTTLAAVRSVYGPYERMVSAMFFTAMASISGQIAYLVEGAPPLRILMSMLIFLVALALMASVIHRMPRLKQFQIIFQNLPEALAMAEYARWDPANAKDLAADVMKRAALAKFNATA